MRNKKFKLKKDIVIPAGTIFENCDGWQTKYCDGNYRTTIGLTKASAGDLTYGILPKDDPETLEWFEEV